jgi:hypothetical protein
VPDYVIDDGPEGEGGDEHADHGDHDVGEARMHSSGEEVCGGGTSSSSRGGGGRGGRAEGWCADKGV